MQENKKRLTTNQIMSIAYAVLVISLLLVYKLFVYIWQTTTIKNLKRVVSLAQ